MVLPPSPSPKSSMTDDEKLALVEGYARVVQWLLVCLFISVLVNIGLLL